MSEKVSIIIPVYNQIEFFEECINSIINQSYLNIEIIIVDDGSDDINAAYYDEIAKKDSRILIYHNINSGVSNARNYGISKSSGKWIMFVDSDDCLTEDAVEFLLSNSCGHKLVMSNYYRGEIKNMNIDKDNIVKEYTSSDIKAVALEYEKYIDNFSFIPVENSAFFLSVWAKLYDAELIRKKDIRFNNELKYCEDLLFNLTYLSGISDVILCSHIIYFYRNNPNSASHKSGIKIINESEKLIEVFLRFDYEKIEDFCAHYLLLTYIDIVQLRDNKLYKKYVDLLKKDLVKKTISNYSPDYLKGGLGMILKVVCLCWQNELYRISYILTKLYLTLRNSIRS